MKTLKIGCWNVTSLRNKDQEIIVEMRRHRIEMCALAETKKKEKGNLRCEEYILIYSGKDKKERATSGVGLLLHEKYENNIQDKEYISDRILHTTLKLQETTMTHIINVYAPDITTDGEGRFLPNLAGDNRSRHTEEERDCDTRIPKCKSGQRGHYRNKEPLQ